MHSYYKKLLEKKRVLKKSESPTKQAYEYEKKYHLEIPEIHIPVASLYRSREFNIKNATPKEPEVTIPMHKAIKRNKELLAQLGLSRLEDLNNSDSKNNAPNPSKGFRKIDPLSGGNKTEENESKRSNPRPKLPELALNESDKRKYQKSPLKDSVFTLRATEVPDENNSRESGIINPYTFQRTKRFFKSKYDRLSPEKVRDLSGILEKNRTKRNAGFRNRSLRQDTEDSQDYGTILRVDTESDRNEDSIYFQRVVISPNRSVAFENGPYGVSTEKLKKGSHYRELSGPSVRASRNFNTSSVNESFDENQLLKVLEADFKKQGEKLDYLRDGKKRNMTLGDKYYLFESINDKYVQKLIDEQRKAFCSISFK